MSYRCQGCGNAVFDRPNRVVTSYVVWEGGHDIAKEKNLCAACAPKYAAEKPPRVVRAPRMRRPEPEEVRR